jgi:DNA repair exonuclease SbcCD ATPase subunit
MKAIEVSAKGFGPFLDEVVLKLHDLGMVLIEGRNYDSTSAKSNGAGKTSVAKAITWAMFGQFVDGDRGSEVIHKRAKRAEVRMVWVDEDTDTAYCITRAQTKGVQSLSLEMTSGDEWVSINGRDKRDTQAKIEVIFGLDYDTWCNTILFAAGDLTRFASRGTSDTVRKAMIKQIYGLGVIDLAREAVVKDQRIAKEAVAVARMAVGRREAQVETVDLNGIEARKQQFEDDRAAAVAMCEETIADFMAQSGEAEPDTELLVDLQGQAAIARSKVTGLTVRLSEASAAATQMSATIGNDLVRGQRADLASKTTELSLTQRQIRQLAGDKCPVCLTSFTDPGTSAKRYRDELQEREGVLLAAIDELRVVVSQFDEKMRKQRSDARVQLELVRRLETELAGLRQQERRLDERIGEIERKPATQFTKLIEAQRAKAEQVKARPNMYVEMLAEAQVQHDKWNELLVKEREVLDDAKTKVQYHEFWNEAFSDRGLISFVIDQMLPQLNRKTNEKLQVLSDGDIFVVFDGETALKSGELRDKVGMRSMIEGIENATPSTAQDKKICLSGALAMMDIVATRQGKRIDLQMLDEPFDGLDDVGKQRLVGLLQKQQEIKGTILVTTHDAMAAGAFTRRILVERRGGVAKLVEEE